jgi:glutamyl-tRNA reductase
MRYQVLSFNYKECTLEQRESIAFKSKEEIETFLKTITDFDFILEAFVINTCNRVEIVTASKDSFATYHTILGILSKTKGINFYELEKSALYYEKDKAVEHIFKVVSSLESMVIGEAQITGQVKEAFKLSYENQTAGAELNRLVSSAVRCAAQVRNATNISENPVSIASVAVAQAEAERKSLSGMVGLVIGAGEMGKLAAKHLLRAGADVLLVSRTKEHAQSLADELGENVQVGDYEKLPYYINKYRLLFTATSAKEPIITKEMVEEKPIERTWFDMAIPRDISKDVNLENIKIYYIDDLQAISNNNHALRKEKALEAAEIVAEHKENFIKWLNALAVEPVIKQMRIEVENIVKSEVQRVVKKGFVPKEYQESLEYMGVQLFDKFLHQPTKQMRQLAKESDQENVIEAIKEIFALNTDSIDPKKYK